MTIPKVMTNKCHNFIYNVDSWDISFNNSDIYNDDLQLICRLFGTIFIFVTISKVIYIPGTFPSTTDLYWIVDLQLTADSMEPYSS